MFTGLIEEVGTVVSRRLTRTGLDLTVQAPGLAPQVAAGDSVAVSGLCLTAVRPGSEQLSFHVGQESIERTTAGQWQPGRKVNLERALAAGARLGGHFVQGHVDHTASVRAVQRQGETVWLAITYPPEGATYLVEKGSVAVDGVSLTAARLAGGQLWIAVVPYTWEHTALVELHPGREVNLEYDLLGKYVVNYLRRSGETTAPGLTEEFLREQGFA